MKPFKILIEGSMDDDVNLSDDTNIEVSGSQGSLVVVVATICHRNPAFKSILRKALYICDEASDEEE